MVNGTDSDWREVLQESVIGPLLFICYINDLPSVMTGCECRIFADDCKIYIGKLKPLRTTIFFKKIWISCQNGLESICCISTLRNVL